jgi:hypothetical protein
MAAEDVDAGLFNILLSDSDADAGSGSEAGKQDAKADRTAMSENAFQALKAEYKVKVENGEVCLLAYADSSCPRKFRLTEITCCSSGKACSCPCAKKFPSLERRHCCMRWRSSTSTVVIRRLRRLRSKSSLLKVQREVWTGRLENSWSTTDQDV